MTIASNPPTGNSGFHLGQLWTDTRYRSTTIQTIALFVVFIAGYWLVDNVVQNLAALGKEFSFGFMSSTAGYDINQRLIEYSSTSTHARAAVVGILNTLLVAFIGCILATIIGVLAGVARLSNNWLLSRLMTVYVEMVRNIPVLIQILLLFAVFSEVLPQPRAFRGDEPEATMLWGSMAFTNRGSYFPAPVWNDGSLYVVVSFLLAIVGAVWFGRWAKKRQEQSGQDLPTFWIKLGVIIGVPVLVFFAMGMPIGLEYPELKGFNFKGGIFARNSLMALTLALAIYTGAFIAETVRAGIQSVSKGQSEAAGALGLRPGRTMSLVILPQALRVIIPPLISQYLNLTKNSSLALLVGYMDATGTLGGITLNQTGKEFETLFLLMAFYLTVSLSVSAVMNLYNENVKLVERTSVSGMGFSVRAFFDASTGPWENLKKGDAKMQDGYGIRGLLNLHVLFYGAWLLALLYYMMIAPVTDMRPSYFRWATIDQIALLLMLITAFGAFITCLFKAEQYLDLIGLELVAFVFAAIVMFPLGALVGTSTMMVIVIGLAARCAMFGHVLLGHGPNLTYFNRVKEEA